MLFNLYRELVKPKEAERYWNIAPAKADKIVQMSNAERKEYLRNAEVIDSQTEPTSRHK